MTGETIYDAVTMISDRLIEEAEGYSFHKKSNWRRFAALAAAFALVVGLGTVGVRYLRMGNGQSSGSGGGGNGGGENGYTYMSYAGPVFPLTALGGAEGVTAARNVDFDFSAWGMAGARGQKNVTDAYVLTNGTDADRTLTLLYPASLSLLDAAAVRPSVTVDGATVETAFYAGPYAGGFEPAWGSPADSGETLNLAEPSSWEDYRALLADGGYLTAAMADAPALDQPVTVYKCDDYVVNDTRSVNPTLQFSFYYDADETALLTYGSNGGSHDAVTGWRSCVVGGLGRGWREDPMYVAFVGKDIDGYRLQGYQDMGEDAGEEIDVSATVTRYETTLGEFLLTLVREHRAEANEYDHYGEATAAVAAAYTDEYLRDRAAELLFSAGVLSETPMMRYDGGRLEEILTESLLVKRVVYLAIEVTVPAGESVGVTVAMYKAASYDYYGAGGRVGVSVNGYDMATRLGSTLAFTEQTASLTGAEQVTVGENNFGFDPEHGVTKVTLDPSAEHYWMQVQRKLE